jgi:hypothetical protein
MTRAGNHTSPIQHKYNMVRTVGVCASESVRIVPDDGSFRLSRLDGVAAEETLVELC